MTELFKKLAAQIVKFGLVGVINTGVDLILLNLFYALFSPVNLMGKFLCAIFAATIACVNSFYMNKKWTFKQQSQASSEQIRGFIFVNIIGLCVNNSVFLFASKYLDELLNLTGFINLNLAKLTGVGAAMAVTFIGYRTGVFNLSRLAAYRERPHQIPETSKPRLSLILLVALMVRIIYAAHCQAAYGDGINYFWTARQLTDPLLADGDWFWLNLHVLLQTPLHFLGLSDYLILMISSLIPGLLLILVIYQLSNRLFNPVTTLAALLIVTFHPRFIEFAINGYSESLAILFILTLLLLCTMSSKDRKVWCLCGMTAGALFLVRNELAVISLAAIFALGFYSKSPKMAIFTQICSALVVIIGYFLICEHLTDSIGFGQKFTTLAKPFSEQLDFAEAARATYSQSPEVSHIAYFHRFGRNLFYLAERLPGILLQPLPLCIPFLYLLQNRKQRSRFLPLIWLFIFLPLPIYLFTHCEPRYFLGSALLLTLLGLHAFLLLCRYFSETNGLRIFRYAILLLCLGLSVLAAIQSQWLNYRGAIHKAVAKELRKLPPAQQIVGDGFGYITGSGFWFGQKTYPRPWLEEITDLESYLTENPETYVLIYESYLIKSKSALLPLFEEIPNSIELLAQVHTGSDKCLILRKK